MLALDDLLEAAHRIFNLDVLSGRARKYLSYMEGLGEETLHLSGAIHGELVLFGELVDSQDGDDVLQILVALQQPLDALRNRVVFLAHHARRENPRSGGERIHCRVDTDLRQRA